MQKSPYMLPIEIKTKDEQIIATQRKEHPHPRVRQKMDALHLKASGLKHKQISVIMGINGNTLRSYLKEYQKDGVKKMLHVNFYQPVSELDAYQATIRKYIEQTPPASIKEAQAKIKELTGIKRGPTQTGIFLKKMGVKLRKVGMVPGNPNKKKFADKKNSEKKN